MPMAAPPSPAPTRARRAAAAVGEDAATAPSRRRLAPPSRAARIAAAPHVAAARAARRRGARADAAGSPSSPITPTQDTLRTPDGALPQRHRLGQPRRGVERRSRSSKYFFNTHRGSPPARGPCRSSSRPPPATRSSVLRPRYGKRDLRRLVLATLFVPAVVLLVPLYLTVLNPPLLGTSPASTRFWARLAAGGRQRVQRAARAAVLRQPAARGLRGRPRRRRRPLPVVLVDRAAHVQARSSGVVSVFAVIAAWKDFLWPLLVLRDPRLQPLSVRAAGDRGHDRQRRAPRGARRSRPSSRGRCSSCSSARSCGVRERVSRQGGAVGAGCGRGSGGGALAPTAGRSFARCGERGSKVLRDPRPPHLVGSRQPFRDRVARTCRRWPALARRWPARRTPGGRAVAPASARLAPPAPRAAPSLTACDGSDELSRQCHVALDPLGRGTFRND